MQFTKVYFMKIGGVFQRKEYTSESFAQQFS
jgi:hypothetical protein